MSDYDVNAFEEASEAVGAVLRAADDAQRARGRASPEMRLAAWRRGSWFVVPASVKIASARKGGRWPG